MAVNIKRIYEQPSDLDGYRILIDRLWPRGVSKERAKLDLWLRDVAPSSKLREWFNHDPAKFHEFSEHYKMELNHNPATEELKKIIAKNKNVTLLYGAKDPQINQAAVLRDYLNR